MWCKGLFGIRRTSIGGLKNVQWIIIILINFIIQTSAIAPSPAAVKQQRCAYQKAYKMYGAYCSGLNLHSVPNTLNSNIEILELSFNRIRDLKNSTFDNYKNVKFLYLGDNMIQTIELNAFEPLQYLEVLDLTLNALRTIPDSILNLPLLRKLYFADNALVHLDNDLANMKKPIRAPLTFLSLANCHLIKFPDFGILPDLEHFNISGNELRDLKFQDFRNFCGLKTIDLTGSFYPSPNVCANKPLVTWFTEQKIAMIPEIFSFINPNSEEFKKCPDEEIDEATLAVYNECAELIEIKEQEKKSKRTWIIVAGCLGGFLVLAVLFLCVMHRRNAKNSNNNNDKEKQEKFLKENTTDET